MRGKPLMSRLGYTPPRLSVVAGVRPRPRRETLQAYPDQTPIERTGLSHQLLVVYARIIVCKLAEDL